MVKTVPDSMNPQPYPIWNFTYRTEHVMAYEVQKGDRVHSSVNDM
jgi:hypothetical protein